MTRKVQSLRPEASPEAVHRATGRSPDEWLAILDATDAQTMTHKDIAILLRERHHVSPWWSQHLTVMYERARGMREKYQSPRGFQVGVNKTIATPLSALYAAWSDAAVRGAWLPEAPITVRKVSPEKSVRAVWDDGSDSTVDINWYERGPARSRITVQHAKLADSNDVERRRAYWKEAFARLSDLFNKIDTAS